MQYPTPWVLTQKSRIPLKFGLSFLRRRCCRWAVALELLLQQSDSDPLSNLQGGGGVGVVVATVGLRSLKQFTIVRIAAADLPRFQLSLVERYWLVFRLRMLKKISP